MARGCTVPVRPPGSTVRGLASVLGELDRAGMTFRSATEPDWPRHSLSNFDA